MVQVMSQSWRLSGDGRDLIRVTFLDGVDNFLDRQFTVAVGKAHMLEERGALVDGNLADRTSSVSKKWSTHDSEEVLVRTSTTNPTIRGKVSKPAP